MTEKDYIIGECFYQADMPCPCCDADECDAIEIVKEYWLKKR